MQNAGKSVENVYPLSCKIVVSEPVDPNYLVKLVDFVDNTFVGT